MDSLSLSSLITPLNLSAAAILLGSAYVYLYYKEKFSYWEKRGVDGPKPTLVLGNILQTFSRPVHEVLHDRHLKFGKVYGTYEMSKPFLTVGDTEMIKMITVKDAHIFINRRNFSDMFDEIFSKFLTSMRDEDWKRVRTIMTPTFTSGKMKKMFHLIDECTTDAIGHLHKNKENIDLKDFFQKYSLEVIAKCCFATRPDTWNNPQNKFFVSAGMLFKPRIWLFVLLLALPKFFARMFSKYAFKSEAIEYFKYAIMHLINERKSKGIRGNDFLQLLIDAQQETNDNDDDAKDEVDVLDTEAHHGNEHDEDVMVSQSKLFDKTKLQKRTLDDSEVIANSTLFFAAGSETTATLLTFVFYNLALHDNVQKTLHEEVQSAEKIDYATVSSLPYLDAVIQETLRLYPAAVLIEREAGEDYALPGTDIVVSKGMVVNVSVYSIHRDPENYPEPEVFDPTRFLPEHRDKIKPYTYLPFGAGPRNCIGMRFALLEAKLMIARMVKEFTVHTTDVTTVPPKFKVGTGLLATEPILVSFKYRDEE